MILYIGVRGIPYGYIFSWARGMGGWEMGDCSAAVAVVAAAPWNLYSENIINIF